MSLAIAVSVFCLVFSGEALAKPAPQTNPPPTGPPPVEPAVVYPPDVAEDTAVESSGAGDGDEPVSPPSTAMQIFQTIKNIVTLSRSSLVEAYEGVVEAAFTKKFGEVKSNYTDAIGNGIGMIEAYGQGGLSAMLASVGVSNEIEELWGVLMGVATVFFPLVLVGNIANVYVSGVSAPIARAEMLQQGASSLLRFVAAGASFWITNQLIILGWATAAAVGTEAGNIGHAGAAELTVLIGGMLFGLFVSSFNIVMFYISLFLLFIILLLIGALILGHLAFMTLVVVWVVISPLAMILGGLPYFGWVQGLWLRMGTGIILLPIVNVILYRFALIMLPNFSNGGNFMQTIVAIGFLSLLTTMNFTLGKFVFGPVMEAFKMAHQSVRKLGNMAISLAGFGIAAGGGNAALGSLAGAGRASGPGGGSAAMAGGNLSVSGAGGAASVAQGRGIDGEGSGRQAPAQTLSERAQAGMISRSQVQQAKADVKLSGRIGAALAKRDPMFSLATTAATARAEHAIGSAEASMPGSNGKADKAVVPSDPGAILRNVPTRVMGVSPASITSPKKDLVQSRAEDFGKALHEAGHLESLARAHVDPSDYVAQMTSMSLSSAARNDLNSAGASIPAYKESLARFDSLGASLYGHGNASVVHERLREGFERDVRPEGRGFSPTVELVQNWIENKRS